MPNTCIACTWFDREAERKEAASLVRCLHEQNREGVWNRVVAAGTRACRRYDPTEEARQRAQEIRDLCDLMML